jgi:hypothetical protein
VHPFRRAGRRTNLALLVLLAASLVTGVLAFGVGTSAPATVVVVAHGGAGLCSACWSRCWCMSALR